VSGAVTFGVNPLFPGEQKLVEIPPYPHIGIRGPGGFGSIQPDIGQLFLGCDIHSFL